MLLHISIGASQNLVFHFEGPRRGIRVVFGDLD